MPRRGRLSHAGLTASSSSAGIVGLDATESRRSPRIHDPRDRRRYRARARRLLRRPALDNPLPGRRYPTLVTRATRTAFAGVRTQSRLGPSRDRGGAQSRPDPRSPGVDADQPVGRGRIALFRECYTLPYSWAVGGFLWAPTPVTGGRREVRRRPGDPHLRSARLLRGYGIKAVDGDIGHVDGFLVDDSSWALRCVVVHTRHWRPGNRV